MKLVKMRLIKRKTANGFWEVNDDVELGKVYIVNLDSKSMFKAINVSTGVPHTLEMVKEVFDGGWFPTELLEEIPDGN